MVLCIVFYLCNYCSLTLELQISIQVIEYDTPEKLLSNEGSAFYRMVQSTGPANAQYLCSLVLGKSENNPHGENDGHGRWLAKSHWMTAAQFALSSSLVAFQNDLERPDINIVGGNDIIGKTKDAVLTLHGVLEGKHDGLIDEVLTRDSIPKNSWWSSFYRTIEGTHALMYKRQTSNMLSRNLHPFSSLKLVYCQYLMCSCLRFAGILFYRVLMWIHQSFHTFLPC